MSADLADGRAIKASGPAVYLMENNQRRWIRNPETLRALSIGWPQVQTVSDAELAQIPQGFDLDLSKGQTVKGTAPAVYLMDGGKRCHIPDMATFDHLGLRRDEIQHLTDVLLGKVPEGSPVPSWGGTHRSAVLDYLYSLAALPAEPSSIKVIDTPPPGTADLEGVIYHEQEHAVRLIKQFDDFGALDPALNVLYPGALVQGRSLLGNQLAPIDLGRAPGTITVTSLVPGSPGSQSRRIDQPTLHSVQDAMTELLRTLNPVASTGGKTEYSEIARTVRHGLLSVNLNVNAGKLAVGADVSFESQKETSTVIWRLNQAYYTVVFEPDRPAYFFDEIVTVDDLKPYTGPDNPPCYLSSVTYGRMLLVLISAATSSQTLKLALSAKYGAILDGKVQSAYDELLSQATIRIFSVGASGNLDVPVLQDPLTGLNDYIANGITFSLDHPGAPIAYRANYLANQNVANVSQTIDYHEITSVWADDVHRDFEVWDGRGGGPISTGIPVAQGDTVTITATGEIWSGLIFFGRNGPEGWTPDHTPPSGAPLPHARAFSLLGGWDNRDWFYAGASWSGQAPGPGTRTLWLGENDNNPYNGDSTYRWNVHVHVKRKPHPELHGVGATA